MMRFRFVPDETNVPFIRFRFAALALSAVLILGSLALIATKGLNFGIDFAGGILMEIRTDGPADLSDMRARLSGIGIGDFSLQEFGAADDVLIRIQRQDGEEAEQQLAIDKVNEALADVIVDNRRTEFVGPQVGEELIQAGIYAVLFSMGGILVYIWLRFEWQFSVAAIAALSHDVLITIGLFAFTQMDFNLATVAAILMIAGYSINDTVVVFDRVREKLRKFRTMELPALFNLAINKTLSRTLLTSVTTMLALVALYVFGGEVIRSFIITLIWGILIGTYSSIFVAAPILLFFDVRPKEEDEEDGAERFRTKGPDSKSLGLAKEGEEGDEGLATGKN